MDELQA
jgi:hypothetical protein